MIVPRPIVYEVKREPDDERYVARRSSGLRLVPLPAEVFAPAVNAGDRDMPKAKTNKRYTDEEKAPILERLKTQSATVVSTATGITTGTLREWAAAAGVQIPDGRTKKIADWVDPPAKAPKKPVTNGHAKPAAPESEGPRLTVSGLAAYIQRCVAEQLPGIVREELQKALANLGRKL